MSKFKKKYTITSNAGRSIELLYSDSEESKNDLFWEDLKEPFKSILEECYYINEEGKYHQLDQITNSIKYNRINYIKLGVQLYQVKYYRLYKNSYDSFKTYCEKAIYYPVWRANQVIDSASIAIKLIKAGFNIIPQNEAQARLLIKLNDDKLIENWQKVLDIYAPYEITANRIEKIVFGNKTSKIGSLKLPIKVISEIEVKALENGMSPRDLITKIISGEITINHDGNVETKFTHDEDYLDFPTAEMLNKWQKDLQQLAFQERSIVDDFAEDVAEEVQNTATDLRSIIKKCFIKSFLQPKIVISKES